MWLSHTRMGPVPVGWGSSCSTQTWSQAGPDVWVGSSQSTHGWGSAGPEGQGAAEGRDGYTGELWDQHLARVWHRLVVGIPVVMDPVARPRSRYSCVVWPAWLRGGYTTLCVSGTELW
jgi:hypothetical protein